MFFRLVLLSALVACVHSLSSPPKGAVTIGPGGKHSTVSAGLADTSSSVYFIYSGTYNEQVYLTRGNIKIYGQTNTPTSYTGNTVTITHSLSATAAGGDDPSGTFRIHATNVSVYNINIANTYGKGSQAIALSTYGTDFGLYGIQLTGYQDTFLSESGYQYVANSYISGAVDFIFGQTASLWIQNSVINSVATGCITASGRSSNDASWYVINDSTVTGTGTGTAYLGRPWSDYARVVFQSTSLSSVINAAGWQQWSSSTPNTDHATFAEYKNSGAGASTSKRVSFSQQLSTPVTLATVFGSAKPGWIDSAFLPA